MSEAKDISGIETCIKILVKNIVLGEKIAKDGIDISDASFIPEVIANIEALVAFVKTKPDIAGEFKDIDSTEVMKLIADLYAGFKEVKA